MINCYCKLIFKDISDFVIITDMDYSGTDVTDSSYIAAACCCCAHHRTMTPEEKAAREKWRQQYIENAKRHPYRYLLKFFSAAAFLAFSVWLVYWQLERGGAFIPIPPGFRP